MQEGIPLRESRKVCYLARDTFFTCCDRNSIENPLRDVENVQRFCKAEKAKFDKDCISSCVYRQALLLMTKVDYFLQKRLTDKRKELMYAQGVAVAPDRGVGQLGSKWEKIYASARPRFEFRLGANRRVEETGISILLVLCNRKNVIYGG